MLVEGVEVNVIVAVAPALDEKAAVREEFEIGAEVEELGVVFRGHQVGLAGADVGEVDAEVLVAAGEDFEVDGVGVDPAEAGDVVVVGAEGGLR